MNNLHPKSTPLAAVVALAISCAFTGCANRQNMASMNPFMAPNRVPPPATRALLPGQAQPYYPGDPLPVMQSGTSAPGDAVKQTAASEPDMPSATQALAWGTPTAGNSNNSVSQANQVNAHPATVPSQNPAAASLAVNEASVAIPGDGNALRFAMPEAQPVEPANFAPESPAPLAHQSPSTVSQPALQLAPPPSDRNVMQAAYTEPVVTQAQTPAPSPWLSPQVAQSGTPQHANAAAPSIAAQALGYPYSMNAPQPAPAYSMPPTIAANTMNVRMREVPSPPMPRIRIPGQDSVQVASSSDGFRARSSMR